MNMVVAMIHLLANIIFIVEMRRKIEG